MRIIGGSARGRRIQAPEGRTTRPITDRAKESIFNMVNSLGGLRDARVADLFAGSGSFGLEAISRGARAVTFVERDRLALATLRANLDHLGFADRATVLGTTVERSLASIGAVDVAFCDPPYADDPWRNLLAGIDADLLIGHAETPVELSPRWDELRRRRYGRSHIVIARRVPEPPT